MLTTLMGMLGVIKQVRQAAGQCSHSAVWVPNPVTVLCLVRGCINGVVWVYACSWRLMQARNNTSLHNTADWAG